MSVTLANASTSYDWRDRPSTDFYPTPSEATLALVRYFDWPKCVTIWEPAAGSGHMVDDLRQLGYSVKGTDIQTGDDFLLKDSCGEDLIITNPPFMVAESFIRKAIELAPKMGFALLLKSQYWHSSRRLNLFREHRPSFVLPLTWRPDFLFGAKSSSPTMEVLWTVWEPGSIENTVYEPLPKPLIKDVRGKE